MPKSLAISAIEASPLRATATTSSRNSFGWGLGTVNILPAAPPGTTDQMSPTRAAVPANCRAGRVVVRRHRHGLPRDQVLKGGPKWT